MDIETSRRREAQESIVPMINVVFLLLIFFLMTSQIAPPTPVEVTAPQSVSGGDPEAELKVFLDAKGTLYFRESAAQDVLAALQGVVQDGERVLLTADKGVEAVKLAAILRQLTALGVPRVELVVAAE